MKSRLQILIRNLFHRAEIEQDLDAEVKAFVDMIADEKVAAGAPQAEAARQARAESGGVEQVNDHETWRPLAGSYPADPTRFRFYRV